MGKKNIGSAFFLCPNILQKIGYKIWDIFFKPISWLPSCFTFGISFPFDQILQLTLSNPLFENPFRNIPLWLTSYNRIRRRVLIIWNKLKLLSSIGAPGYSQSSMRTIKQICWGLIWRKYKLLNCSNLWVSSNITSAKFSMQFLA